MFLPTCPIRAVSRRLATRSDIARVASASRLKRGPMLIEVGDDEPPKRSCIGVSRFGGYLCGGVTAYAIACSKRPPDDSARRYHMRQSDCTAAHCSSTL
eukprot:scaffold12093_cov137-Isochrysis_galbana.AAC.12